MMRSIITTAAVLFLAVNLASCASSAVKLDQNAEQALEDLLSKSPKARELANEAVAVLVFPRITKAGFGVGGQHGNGALIQGGVSTAYYKSVAISYGIQAGMQQFGYALFFMNQRALGYLNRSGGWEVGVGPSIVVVQVGVARAMTTTTLKSDIYASFFNQAGLMAGTGIQGTKITRIYPD